MTRKNEAGQALVLAALALTVLMGFAGLAIDMGVLRYEKRLQQTAADSAAIAGADELRYGDGSAGITSSALNASSTNGFTDTAGNSTCPPPAPKGGVGTVMVTVCTPPSTGPHSGSAGCSPAPSCYVEVYVTKVQPTFFMKILKINSEPVTARAVATMISNKSANAGCVYTLGTGIAGDISTSGNPTLRATTCGIEDNGGLVTHGKPVDIQAGSIGIAGPYTNNGGGTVTCGGSTANCPATGLPPIEDPLTYIPAPSVSAPGVAFNAAKTPVPGTTYSSITINSGSTVNFPAGTYVVDGNFRINGGATVTGTGVTFYMTGGGGVTMNGTATIQLSAPNSGTYAGILFDQNPADTSTATFVGTANSYFQGALYFPTAELDFGGNNFTNDTCTGPSQTACAQYTIIVSDSLVLHGGNILQLGSDYAGLPGGVTIIKQAVLVE